MRRKLAALLAGAMVLTSLPMVSFAASTNRVSRVPVIAKDQTIEEVGGSFLTITEKDYLKEEIEAEGYFNLILTNGEWTKTEEYELSKDYILMFDRYGTLIYDESKVSLDDDGIRNYADGIRNYASLDDINVNFDEADAFVMKKITNNTVQVQVYKNKNDSRGTGKFDFAIPLDAVKCTAEEDVLLTVDDYDSGVSRSEKLTIAVFAKDATKSTIESKKFSHVLDLNEIKIEELQINTLSDGELKLEILNDDFDWIWNPGVDRDVKVRGTGIYTKDNIKAVIDVDKSTDRLLVLAINGLVGKKIKGDKIDQRGSIYIEGLQIRADRNADFGVVEVEINGDFTGGCNVTKEVLEVGEYVDYGVTISFDEEDMVAGYDQHTYKITLEEDVPGSWYSERRTLIEFPDYVRVAKVANPVTIVEKDCDNIADRRANYSYVDDQDNKVKSPYAYVDYDDHWIEFMDIREADPNNTTKLVFEVTLEVKAGATGDITAKFSGPALLGYEEEVVLGKIITPFTVDVEAVELKAGLKVQDFGKFSVTELDAGRLPKGTKLYFELEDYLAWDTKPEVEVTGDIDVDVNILEQKGIEEYTESVATTKVKYEVYKRDGNDIEFMEEKDDWSSVLTFCGAKDGKIDADKYYIRKRTEHEPLTKKYEHAYAKGHGRILVVEVKKASRKEAATLTFSGGKLLVDRTIPEGTFNMAVTTLGSKWHGWGSWYDDLYVDITTPNTEDIEQSKNAKYTATFTLDSVNYTVDGVTLQADVAPYAKDGRIMVPVRYVAQGLGVNPDDVLYSNKTVTIMNGNRIVQLVLGSNVMKVNGAEITMDTVAEAKDGRIFVPMGWIAKGLGVPVQWDNNTKTATFN